MTLLSNLLLEQPQIIGIAIGAVAAILVVIILILIFRKKPSNKTIDDRALVAENAKRVETLIVLAEGNEETVTALKDLQEQLKYLVPVNEKKVYDYDLKIKHGIEDLKIVLTKDGKDKADKTASIIKDIKVLVADRNINVL